MKGGENMSDAYDSVDAVVKQTSSGKNILKLEDGKEYFLRIASEPRYVIRHWFSNPNRPVLCEGENCQYCGKQVDTKNRMAKVAQWAWIVIDRQDNGVKILQGPNTVALSLRDLKNAVFPKGHPKAGQRMRGEPTEWDITLKREKSGAEGKGVTKYTIQVVPDTTYPLTSEEKEKIAASNINLEAVLQGSKRSENIGNYGSEKKELETAPDEDTVNPDDIPENLGEDSGASDLPF